MTGALILAAVALLEGRQATTHWAYHPLHWAYHRLLERLGATYRPLRNRETRGPYCDPLARKDSGPSSLSP